MHFRLNWKHLVLFKSLFLVYFLTVQRKKISDHFIRNFYKIKILLLITVRSSSEPRHSFLKQIDLNFSPIHVAVVGLGTVKATSSESGAEHQPQNALEVFGLGIQRKHLLFTYINHKSDYDDDIDCP